MSRATILEQAVGLGLPLLVLVAVDWATIRLDDRVALEVLGGAAVVVAAVVAPVVFIRVSHRRLPPGPPVLRWAAVVVGAAACSLVWLFLAFIVFVNIHLALGGAL